MDELQKRIEKDLKQLRETPEIIDHFKLYDAWREKHIKEFNETKQSLKYIFRKEGLALPKNWEELFKSWVWNAPLGSAIRDIMGSTLRERRISELEPIPKEYFIR